ncbi:hypothetical protein AAFF_G00364630 [Aldrovandia affinis]|uniref:Gypsy retrotransposon integrase-like protein 1 n=1 Tax=Aldrovandia affinis TaxID=143900 RepID=A0AAD7WMS2_9TELE|nr:hypothetical protein AAFF_G00364630 [Aldrovandia affinis]
MRRVFDVLGRTGGGTSTASASPGRTIRLGLLHRVRTLATSAGWNAVATYDAFLHGLSERVLDELTVCDLPQDLDRLVDLAIRIDTRLQERGKRRQESPASPFPPNDTTRLPAQPMATAEPMQVNRTHLSETERQRRREGGLCLYCGGKGHFRLSCPVKDSAHPDGHALAEIQEITQPLDLLVSGNHREKLAFYLMESPLAPVVLGGPWLATHNPSIDWATGNIREWSVFCQKSCLRSATTPGDPSSRAKERPVDLSLVPPEYHDLGQAFSKSRACTLPPHRAYDCPINLLPGSTPPRGHLYSLSVPENKAMEEYISTSLTSGIIRPSSSPAGAGFFFVKKKDGTLRPCIDYRGLNAITIKNRYPLPLMSSAFDNLQEGQFFTKLDLRNAYHLVRIREGMSGRRPSTPTQFSFRWNPDAQEAFERLKSRFTSAPILALPDPTRSKNIKPDALSRIYDSPEEESSPEPILPPSCVLAAAKFDIVRAVEEALLTTRSHRETPANRLFVPETVRSQVLEWAHSSPMACHPGVSRTLAFLSRRFWWPTMRNDTVEFVTACVPCARSKSSNARPSGLLQPLAVPRRPWSHVALDFVTGLPPSEGDDLGSGSPVFQRVLESVLLLIGAKPNLSSGFHPETNGQTERYNQELGKGLRCLAEQTPTTWSRSLPWVEYAHNSLPVSSTGMSPFQCSLGYQPPLFPEEEREVEVPSAKVFVNRAQKTWRRARATLLRHVSAMKSQADRRRRPAPHYRVALLSAPHLPPGSSKGAQSTLFAACWMSDAGAVVANFWWIGRAFCCFVFVFVLVLQCSSVPQSRSRSSLCSLDCLLVFDLRLPTDHALPAPDTPEARNELCLSPTILWISALP